MKVFKTATLKPFLLRSVPYLLAVAAAFGVVGVIIIMMGYDPLAAFSTLIYVPFGSVRGLIETLIKFVPLLLAALAFAIPFKAGLFNIGGWGQVMAGGMTTAVVGLALKDVPLPSLVFIPLLLLAGFLGGALWATVPAFLRTRFEVKEIVSTIMMNFVALYLINFIATNEPWKDIYPGHPTTLPIPAASWLPKFGRFHMGIIMAIVVAIAVYFLINRLIAGYEIKAVGANPTAARVFGIGVKRVMVISLIFGGAMAGMAGAIEVMGVQHRLLQGFELTGGAHYGIFGILITLIAAGNFIGIPFAAFFISVLIVGADAMQRTMGIPVELVFITQALLVLFIVWFREVKLLKK